MMPNPNSPCKDCENRVVGCHGKCEKYKAFVVERVKLCQQNYEQREKERQAETVLITGAIKKSGRKPPER